LFRAIDGGETCGDEPSSSNRSASSSQEEEEEEKEKEEEEEEGLLIIEKIPISRVLIENLARRGITKLFPIQVRGIVLGDWSIR
jgi:superfamily II DNA/RNA helicase